MPKPKPGFHIRLWVRGAGVIHVEVNKPMPDDVQEEPFLAIPWIIEHWVGGDSIGYLEWKEISGVTWRYTPGKRYD
jgi:hypothetical protein